MALPLSYNVRNVRSALAGDAARHLRHRPRGHGLRVPDRDVLGLPPRPARHGAPGQRDHRPARLRLRADLGHQPRPAPASSWSTRGSPRGADGQPLASPEILIVANLKRKARRGRRQRLRARRHPKAFEVRGGIKMVQGQPLHPRPRRGHRRRARGRPLRPGPRLLREDPEARLEDRGHLHLRGQRLRERDLGRPQRHGRPPAPRGRVPGRGRAPRRPVHPRGLQEDPRGRPPAPGR